MPPSKEKKSFARVSLVGAGPGHPGLLTLWGLNRLRQADVVVYDALANAQLLAEAKPSAKRIDVGKRAARHTMPQEAINRLLVKEARRIGKNGLIVRLKGGDPYVFGRGSEEAIHLARHGIECETVPGITAGLAAPALAGIPVTHRGLSTSITLVTGHEDPTKKQTSVNYPALAQLLMAGGTCCFYMGVSRLESIVGQLVRHGTSDAMPAAVVQWGTTAQQRCVRSTLKHLARDVAKAKLTAPAIIVVGPTAAIDDPGLNHFADRPLFGQRFLITRTRQQMSDLRVQLQELGAQVLEAPTIELVPPSPATLRSIDLALRDISKYDWLILTSANGASVLADRLAKLNRDARSLAAVKIAAIGQATAAALKMQLGIQADLVPTRYVAESLAAELIAQQAVKGQHFLLLRADIARPALPKLLKQAGAKVTEITAYRTVKPKTLSKEVLQALADGNIDWVTFTSASTAANLASLLGRKRSLVSRLKIASIGPITTQAIHDADWEPTVEAEQSDIPGLVKAIVQQIKKPV